ncbi:histone acetyltransferase p300-like isoform X2 [Microplitis mediator]|uniref:histone acetyltransferase p300-like isoform X2 n=1 Tax=Microplitis mediator TaxID=375433 RepID=UPI002557A363|nr:histone acetyltransferase p300-like isoform X2 [Microplitis mediator]
MDNKEEQISGNDDGSPNSQGVNRPQGLNGVIQMPIQQQQQTHMVNQARGQSPCPYQRFDHGGIAGPDQSGPRMQAPPNMQNIPNTGQMGVSSPHGDGLSGPIGVSNSMSNNNEITQQLQQPTPSPAQPQSGAPTGGQPDPQQATQGPVAGGSTQSGSTSSTHDPDHHKLIQQQLVLLLHAHKCQLRERQANGEARICSLPHCITIKNVLTHMTTCEEGKECTIPHCSSSRQIITHWKQCQKSDCPVCLPIKQADKNKSAISRADVTANQPLDTMGITQGQNNTAGILSNEAVGHDVRMPGPGMQGHLGSMTAGIRLAQSQAEQSPGQSVGIQGHPIAPNVPLPLSSDPTTVVVSTNQPASTTGPTSVVCSMHQLFGLNDSSQPAQIAASPVLGTKQWHRSVTPDFRNFLVHIFVQAIIPGPNPQVIFDKRLHTIVAYARKVEGDMYEMANSRSEYYYLLGKKIRKIQKELEEKRQKRKEMQLAVNSRL